ncbi:MAG TPA: ATP-binding protein [Kofleriaceae bacterium]|nr:ATP-binding protein [Kofleriaceae bacterium]
MKGSLALSASFRAKLFVGYAAIILLLAGGMVFAIEQFGIIATRQVKRVRDEEMEITVVERLRWTGELIVSLGRGYIISGDSRIFVSLQNAQSHFDRAVTELRDASLNPEGDHLVAATERAADAFRHAQDDILLERQRTDDATALRRLETELLPLRLAFTQSLDRLVFHKEGVIASVYDQAAADRAQLKSWLYALFAALVATGFGISWYFGRLLSRSYSQEIEARDVASQALATRDQVMGMVAHDLRNPLAAIVMKAGVIRHAAGTDQIRRQAASIENVTGRMANLIQAMLDATTIDTGQFTVSKKPCSLDELIAEIDDIFANLSESRHVRFRVDRAIDTASLTVLADRERVLQVLSNLLGNALKFTPEGGEIILSDRREDGMIRFAVSDTGPGIDPSQFPNLFDRFWREETSGNKGTGLGLYIAKGIVDAHGGRIWIDSNPGRGATFFFTIPLTTEPIPGITPTPRRPSAPAPFTEPSRHNA